MKVIKTGGHNEMCGGYSYTYKVVLDFYDTVEDALEEIREWRKENANPKEPYGIYVNNKIVESTWVGEKKEGETFYKKWYHGSGTEKVLAVHGDGGWYCGINFNIITER